MNTEMMDMVKILELMSDRIQSLEDSFETLHKFLATQLVKSFDEAFTTQVANTILASIQNSPTPSSVNTLPGSSLTSSQQFSSSQSSQQSTSFSANLSETLNSTTEMLGVENILASTC